MAYLWAAGDPESTVRFFYTINGSVFEDPATGSACANLGGWHIVQRRSPMTATLRQGDAVGRPSRLGLRVDGDGGIYVTGSVIELGRGTINPRLGELCEPSSRYSRAFRQAINATQDCMNTSRSLVEPRGRAAGSSVARPWVCVRRPSSVGYTLAMACPHCAIDQHLLASGWCRNCERAFGIWGRRYATDLVSTVLAAW